MRIVCYQFTKTDLKCSCRIFFLITVVYKPSKQWFLAFCALVLFVYELYCDWQRLFTTEYRAERFHSRLCKFVGTKEIVYMRKAFNIPHDWFGTPTWPAVSLLRTQIWPRDSISKFIMADNPSLLSGRFLIQLTSKAFHKTPKTILVAQSLRAEILF